MRRSCHFVRREDFSGGRKRAVVDPKSGNAQLIEMSETF
jgi:hypothetical protein